MRQLAKEADVYAASVVAAVTKAVEQNRVVTLSLELDELKKQFVEGFTGQRIGKDEIAKSDEQQMVWGWASVSTVNGELLTDAQGDECDVTELQKAAHEFMQSSRVGKVMHAGRRKGYIADSIVFTKALQDALGIDLGMEGWFVGYKVEDPETWSRVKKGELRAFSIGGLGNREPLSKFNPHHDGRGRFSSAGAGEGPGSFGGGVKAPKQHAITLESGNGRARMINRINDVRAQNKRTLGAGAHASLKEIASSLKAGKLIQARTQYRTASDAAKAKLKDVGVTEASFAGLPPAFGERS